MASGLNILSQEQLDQVSIMYQRCESMVTSNITMAADTCDEIINYFKLVSGNVFSYDARIFDYDYDPF